MNNLEKYLDFVSPDEIRIKGHRIWIEHVLLCHLDEGMGPAALAARFPSLEAQEIEAVLAYYGQHRADLDAYLTAWKEHEDRVFREAELNPSPARSRLRELKAELAVEGKLPSQRLTM